MPPFLVVAATDAPPPSPLSGGAGRRAWPTGGQPSSETSESAAEGQRPPQADEGGHQTGSPVAGFPCAGSPGRGNTGGGHGAGTSRDEGLDVSANTGGGGIDAAGGRGRPSAPQPGLALPPPRPHSARRPRTARPPPARPPSPGTSLPPRLNPPVRLPSPDAKLHSRLSPPARPSGPRCFLASAPAPCRASAPAAAPARPLVSPTAGSLAPRPARLTRWSTAAASANLPTAASTRVTHSAWGRRRRGGWRMG
jgi:hypothetical protein